ncbi:MAG: rod shape-determining protein MreD [Actinomycetota bacterium]|nr:rod shape-determining protein MreD [Actinomycetota bacterium]
MNVNVRFALVLAVAFICQAAVVPFISIGPIKPDIILIIVASFGFLDGAAPGAVGGFLGGLLQDLLTIRGIGLEVLIKTIVGGFSGRVERTILGNSPIMPMLAIGGVSIVSQILYIGLAFLTGERMELLTVMREVVLPSALYTATVGFFIFPQLSKILSAERQDKVFR